MIVSWSLFALYVVGTLWLARLGQKRTTSFESYAVGDRAMHPFVAGMALAASTAVALAWRVAGLRRAARAPTAAPPAEP